MGKRLEDLPLRDTPLSQPTDDALSNTVWGRFVQDIDELLGVGDFDWARDTLEGIRETALRMREVTPAMSKAVDNIRNARRRADGWRQRYNNYRR